MKNRIFTFILVVAVIILAVVWQVNHSNQVERERMNRRYEKAKYKLEMRLEMMELKAKILFEKIELVRVANYIKTLKGWNYDE